MQMKMKGVSGLLSALIFMCFACNNQPKEGDSLPGQTDELTFVPGERFGLITPENATRGAVLSAYGDQAKADSIYLAEGMIDDGVVIYPDEPKKTVYVYWDKEIDAKRPAFIRIIGDSTGATEWRSPDGLTLGTTLAEVERMNGKPFKLTGFGWDYGGRVTDWQGGQLAGKGLSFVFQPAGATDEKFLGDVIIDSNDSLLAGDSVSVVTIEMRFLAREKLPDCLQAKVDESLKKNSWLSVRKMQVNGKDHFWLADGAVAYDGIEYVYDAECNEVCRFGGMRQADECTQQYNEGTWTTVWENQ